MYAHYPHKSTASLLRNYAAPSDIIRRFAGSSVYVPLSRVRRSAVTYQGIKCPSVDCSGFMDAESVMRLAVRGKPPQKLSEVESSRLLVCLHSCCTQSIAKRSYTARWVLISACQRSCASLAHLIHLLCSFQLCLDNSHSHTQTHTNRRRIAAGRMSWCSMLQAYQ
jgi:hypothetical protein